MDRTTETLARYATSLRYGDLSPGAVKEAKRHVIDSLGCAMGGATSGACRHCPQGRAGGRRRAVGAAPG
jgi:2-methylcitrate dehydratase PrpD